MIKKKKNPPPLDTFSWEELKTQFPEGSLQWKNRLSSNLILEDKRQCLCNSAGNWIPTKFIQVHPGGSDGKDSACSAGDLGSIPGLRRQGRVTPSSILAWRIPMDRGAWRAVVRRVANSRTRLKQCSTHVHTHTHTRIYSSSKNKLKAIMKKKSDSIVGVKQTKTCRKWNDWRGLEKKPTSGTSSLVQECNSETME